MGLIREPKDVDFSNKSEPWTEQELADFRNIMNIIKQKNTERKEGTLEVQEKIDSIPGNSKNR